MRAALVICLLGAAVAAVYAQQTAFQPKFVLPNGPVIIFDGPSAGLRMFPNTSSPAYVQVQFGKLAEQDALGNDIAVHSLSSLAMLTPEVTAGAKVAGTTSYKYVIMKYSTALLGKNLSTADNCPPPPTVSASLIAEDGTEAPAPAAPVIAAGLLPTTAVSIGTTETINQLILEQARAQGTGTTTTTTIPTAATTATTRPTAMTTTTMTVPGAIDAGATLPTAAATATKTGVTVVPTNQAGSLSAFGARRLQQLGTGSGIFDPTALLTAAGVAPVATTAVSPVATTTALPVAAVPRPTAAPLVPAPVAGPATTAGVVPTADAVPTPVAGALPLATTTATGAAAASGPFEPTLTLTFMFGFSENKTFPYGKGTVSVPANGLKFTVEAANWPFCDPVANSLKMELNLDSGYPANAAQFVLNGDAGNSKVMTSMFPNPAAKHRRNLLQGLLNAATSTPSLGSLGLTSTTPVDPYASRKKITKLLITNSSAAAIDTPTWALSSSSAAEANVTVLLNQSPTTSQSKLAFVFPAFKSMVYDPTIYLTADVSDMGTGSSAGLTGLPGAMGITTGTTTKRRVGSSAGMPVKSWLLTLMSVLAAAWWAFSS